MGVYLSILVGPRPDQATPVLASSDTAVVRAALSAVIDRLNLPGVPGDPRPLRVARREQTQEAVGAVS